MVRAAENHETEADLPSASIGREETVEKTTLMRRTVLWTTALATTALAAPFAHRAHAAASVVSSGSMVLAWHTNIAPRWLDLQQHDGGATPDNFLNVLHDALIKNSRDELYDHVALAERYEFAEDARSATLWLRPGTSSSTMMPRSHRTTSNATTAPGPQCRRQHRWCGDARPPHLPLLPFLDPALKEFLIGATSRQFGLSATRSRRSGRRSVQRCRYSAVWSLPRRRRRHSLCRSAMENRQRLR